MDKIFEHRKNVIWDENDCYILEYVPTGAKCRFDHADAPLEAIKKALMRDGNATPNGTKGLSIRPCRDHKQSCYYVSQLLYSVYSGKPMEWVRSGRIRYFDGDHENLTSANLVHTKDNCSDNLNRRIFFAGNVMFLYVKSCKTCYFCDYDPELYKLLCECQITWAYNKRNRQIHAKIDGILFGFHTLIYAFHHYGARQNNFISAIQKLQADLHEKKLTIDHLDDSQENNLIWNLSLMTDSQNGRKSDIFGKVRWPFFAFAVYHNKKYKVLFGRVREGDVWFVPEFDANFVICNTPDDLIDFARHFMTCEWGDGLSPAKNLKDHPNNICFQDYFGDFGATGIREELMEKPEEEFAEWTAGNGEVGQDSWDSDFREMSVSPPLTQTQCEGAQREQKHRCIRQRKFKPTVLMGNSGDIKRCEDRFRLRLASLGYELHKGVTVGGNARKKLLKKGAVKRGYQIIDGSTGKVVAGKRFEMSLNGVEQWWRAERERTDKVRSTEMACT